MSKEEDRQRLLASLEHIRTLVRDGVLEAAEDEILDLMDAITGFCHPSARLFADDAETLRAGDIQ